MVALAAGELGCHAVMIREDGSRSEMVIPVELVGLIDRWPMVSESIRRVVLALLDGTLPKPIEAALLALLDSVG